MVHYIGTHIPDIYLPRGAYTCVTVRKTKSLEFFRERQNFIVSSLLFAMHHLSQASSRSLRQAAAQATKPSLARGAHKEIKFSNEGRAAILKGVDVLAKAVSVTLGPK